MAKRIDVFLTVVAVIVYFSVVLPVRKTSDYVSCRRYLKIGIGIVLILAFGYWMYFIEINK